MCEACPQPHLLPENALAARAFNACSTQWRHAGWGAVRTGMDGAACAALIERGIGKWQRELHAIGVDASQVDVADVLDDLHVMEQATIDADVERRKE